MESRKGDNFEKLFKALSMINFEIGSHFYAKPTYLIDPCDFYIIPFPFLYHLRSLSKPGKQYQTEELKENSVVIYKSINPDVNKYIKIDLDDHIRGVIQSIDNDKRCVIHAMDRGFIEKDVSVDRIFHPASVEASNTPSLIHHCELDMCVPIGPNFNKDAIEAFKFYIGNEKLSVVVRGKSIDKLKIVVYNSNPDDIATLLSLTHYTTLSSNISIDCPTRSKLTYQHIQLSKGEVFNARVQSGTSLKSFYVSPIWAYRKYLQNRADFTNFCKNVPVITNNDFNEGNVVGIHDDASLFYERAVITEILDPEKAKVKLVDWGTELEVTRNRIKSLKTDFYLTSPACAVHCSVIDGFIPWDNGLSNFLYRGYALKIKIKKVGKGFDIPHIVALAQT